MSGKAMIVAIAGSVVLVASSTATAQHWGRGAQPRDGACFFKDPDFRGDYFCVRAGQSQRDMPRGMNDKITSIRLFGATAVIVYQDSKYEGRSTRFDGDVHNLRHEGWNDLISSFRVVELREFGRRRDRRRERMTAAAAEQIVRDAYRRVLGREPDPTAQGYVRRVLDDGWTQSDVERDLRKSAEYRSKH